MRVMMVTMLAVASAGCGGDEAPPPTPSVDAATAEDSAPAADVGPTTRSLVDNHAWTLVPLDADPFVHKDTQGATHCGAGEVGVEELPDGPWFEVETSVCAYMTAQTPLLADMPVGGTIALRIWHFAATGAVGPFWIAVAVGEPPQTVFEATLEAPNTKGGLLHDTWTVEVAWPAGAPVYWHVSNHGSNTWGFIELSVTD